MLEPEVISTCCRLLRLYKGVTVERSSGHPSGQATFILRITEPASVARLAFHASDAVMRFEVWPASHAFPPPESEPRVQTRRNKEDWGSPELIRYVLQATPSPEDEGEPQLKVVTLCVCIAIELADLGLLLPEETERLRAEWGF